MNRFKWQGFAVLAVGLATGFATASAVAQSAAPAAQAAQAPTAPAQHAKARLDIVAAAVADLSADQKAKILDVYTKAYQTQDDMRAKGQTGEPVRDVMEKADDDAKAVLTDAQKSKWPSGRALRAAGL